MRRRYNIAAVCLSLLLLAGCGAKQYTIHPGAVDEFDSRTYDLLLAVQGGLDQAKAEFAAGNLPERAKAIINSAGESHNLLDGAWRSYRTYKQTGNTGDELADAVAKIQRLTPILNQFLSDLAKLFERQGLKLKRQERGP